jgi:enoyl-CoA hydratase
VIEVTEREGVVLLRLAEGKANAMSLEFCEALTARFAALSEARAVVLTGTGHIFSAGVDLKRLVEGDAAYVRKFMPALSTMLAAVFSHPAPVVAAINGHAIAGGCVLACAADRRLMARNGGRIGVTELLVGVPFPTVAMEIMRCATAPKFFADAIFSGATYTPLEAVERGWVHDVTEEEHALLHRSVEAANALAALPPKVFALSKRQTRRPALERMKDPELDAAIAQIWNAPETLARIRDYVVRTLRK